MIIANNSTDPKKKKKKGSPGDMAYIGQQTIASKIAFAKKRQAINSRKKAQLKKQAAKKSSDRLIEIANRDAVRKKAGKPKINNNMSYLRSN